MNKLFHKKSLAIKLDNRSKYLRKLIIQSLIGGGRGHMGSAMSLVEILRVLYDEFMNFDPRNLKKENRDRLILSKGHGCLALYSILADKKFFPKTKDNEFYINDLIECMIFLKDNTSIGKVLSVQNFGAGDLLESKHCLMLFKVGSIHWSLPV